MYCTWAGVLVYMVGIVNEIIYRFANIYISLACYPTTTAKVESIYTCTQVGTISFGARKCKHTETCLSRPSTDARQVSNISTWTWKMKEQNSKLVE